MMTHGFRWFGVLLFSVCWNLPAALAVQESATDEPALIRSACQDLVLTQFGNSDKQDRSKMCVGDRLLKWNGIELTSNDDLISNWIKCKAGELTRITVERDFGTAGEPEKETIVVTYRHVGASELYRVCLAGGRTEYRLPDEINPELDAAQPSLFQTEVEQILEPVAPQAISRLSNAFGRFTSLVKGHYRNDQVAYLLNRPFRGESWGRRLADGISANESIKNQVGLLWQNADPQNRPLPDAGSTNGEDSVLESIEKQLAGIDAAYEKAFAPLTDEERKSLVQFCHDFKPLWQGSTGWDIFTSQFQLTKKIDLPELMRAITLSAALADDLKPGGALLKKLQGEIKTQPASDDLVIGTDADETHTVSGSIIIDAGGNDRYLFAVDPNVPFRSRLIIDFGGDDTYVADQLGIACGAMSTSILIDVSGDDEYRVEQKGIGFALMGLGLLLDVEGNDRYLGNLFTQGTACIGVGLVADRSGNDRYDAGSYSQGVGLPGGCGAIVDSLGDDVYLCTGKTASPYGDAGEFSGWGQGCGFGFRYLGCGGIGVLIDGAGHDVYRSGQFGLGCGYFFGIGLVNDRAGNDWFECSRYGLASAAHYGVGIVLDDGGNDTYSAIRSACVAVIGSTWDLSLGVLVDGAGNDVYRGNSYAMGGAAQTAYGFLWDKSGDDLYASPNTAAGPVLGYIGGNSYGAGRLADNLAVFFDGGGKDHYQGAGRKNGNSGVEKEFGVWIDK